MSKSAKRALVPSKEEKYLYPSRFGSHKSMVIEENADGTVILADEFGIYTTTKDRLDDGVADPKRYAESRIQKLFAGGEKKEDK